MGFQIHNKDGEAISLQDLDKEAADFWNKELHKKQYATPIQTNDLMSPVERLRSEMCGSWFDIIGHQIHKPFTRIPYTTGWDNIKANLCASSFNSVYKALFNEEEMIIKLEGIKLFLRPYFDLIDHWKQKEYIPVKTDD